MIKKFMKLVMVIDQRRHANQSGFLLVAVLVLALIFSIIGVALLESATGQFRLASDAYFQNSALLVAEAGIEQSVHQLNADDTFGGYPTAQQFFSNDTQGRGAFTTTITNDSAGNAKTIVSTGLTYREGSTDVVAKRILKVTVVGTSSTGYSVLTGPGGLILGGSANITNSQVNVNGSITLNGASKIGTPDNPLTINVANMHCPTGASPGPTYPQVCSDGTQPISMAYSTAIYGSVCATGQTSTGPNNNIKTGNGGAGLEIGCTAPPVSPPTYDRNAQISSVSTTATSTDNTYVCNKAPFDRTWPANLEITGDVTVNHSCNILVKGNVYITGDLTIGGAAKITVDDSVGTTQPVVMVDGKITVAGSGSIIANSSGTGIKFISFKSAAACGPNCATLTGNDLKASQSLDTVDIGGAVNLPGMVFQAYWGKLTLGGSGNVGAVAGQTIDMSGAGTVIFGTELSSGARTWAITSYQQMPNP